MKRYITLIFAVLLFNTANAQENSSEIPYSYTMDTIMLKEVAVTATRPLSRIKDDGVITTVSGTMLDKLGTANDVLGFIPGIVNNNGSIEIFGKGSPAIYINGRLVRNYIELEQLSSEKIKDVTVINNPGAKYGSDTKAVIQISTIKEFGEGFALNTKTTIGYLEYLYGKERVGMNYRSGKFDFFSTLEYNNTRFKSSNMNELNTWLDNNEKTLVLMDSDTRNQLFDGTIGFNYTADSIHSFGVYYKTKYKPTRTHINSSSSMWINGIELDNGNLYQYNETNFYQYLVNAYYSGDYGKLKIDLNVDYLYRGNNEKQSVKENDNMSGINSITIQDESFGKMLAGELHASYPIRKGSLNFGTEYTSSQRDDNFYNIESVMDNNNNRIEEENMAVYGEFLRNFGQISLKLGLRYEHTNNQYFEFGQKSDDLSQRYDELLPSATLTFPIKKTIFQLVYSRKFTRPLYSQLSSTIYYVNQYLYETGNPLLKTPFNDNISLNVKYKWLTMSADYKHISGQVITTCTSYNDSITLLKKVNSPNDIHNFQIMVSAMPGFIGKFYYPVLACGAITQLYEMDYRGESMNLNRPMMIVQFNNIFALPHSYMLTTNFRYRSKGDSDNVRMNSNSWQIDFSITKTFNKHWDVKLLVNDIFNTAKNTYFTMYSGIMDMNVEKTVNTRYVELNIGYKFNMPKSKYKGKGAGNSEKERL